MMVVIYIHMVESRRPDKIPPFRKKHTHMTRTDFLVSKIENLLETNTKAAEIRLGEM